MTTDVGLARCRRSPARWNTVAIAGVAPSTVAAPDASVTALAAAQRRAWLSGPATGPSTIVKVTVCARDRDAAAGQHEARGSRVARADSESIAGSGLSTRSPVGVVCRRAARAADAGERRQRDRERRAPVEKLWMLLRWISARARGQARSPCMPEFTHLHLHTQYSLLDGAIRLKDLFPKVLERGMKTVAVTDHGNMFGAIDFYTEAKAARRQADLRLRDLRRARPARQDRAPVEPPHPAREERGRLQEPLVPQLDGLPRGLLLQPAHRQAAPARAHARA